MTELTPALIGEMWELKEKDQEKYWENLARLSKEVGRDTYAELRKVEWRLTAMTDTSLVGFKSYYRLIHGNEITEHNERSAEELYRAHDEGRIFLYLGSRKFRKTTTFDITFASFMIGHFPNETSIITGASDPNAKLIAKSIAQIIESHPEFKAVFSNIIPYKERGWGAEGYWVRDNRKSIEEWTAMQAKINDPAFVGGGYKSAEVNGKHPTLLMIVDDLHDIDTSASVVERDYIKKVFIHQILPTAIQENDKLKTWVLMTGVPFAKDDTYGVLKDTGQCVFVSVPCMKRAAEGTEGAVYIDGVNREKGVSYEDIVGWWVLTWPEEFGVQSVITNRSYGKAAFWQMYMMDIERAKTTGLRYYLCDRTRIGFDLPTGGGADPTTIDPDKEVGGQKRSSFALSYLCKLPNGTLALRGGVLKPMGILAAKEVILQAQAMFVNWITTSVEGVGAGKMFQQFLRLDSRVKFRDSNITDPKGIIRDKKARFEYEIAPWLENAVILISDEENEYCMAVRSLCDNFFDIDGNKPDERLDAGDGLYHAAKLFPEVLRNYVLMQLNPAGIKPIKTGLGSPWNSLGAGHGRGTGILR